MLPNHRVYFVNHKSKTTQWEDPRRPTTFQGGWMAQHPAATCTLLHAVNLLLVFCIIGGEPVRMTGCLDAMFLICHCLCTKPRVWPKEHNIII